MKEWAFDLLDKFLGAWFAAKVDHLITVMDAKMPELIQYGLIICGLAMMIPVFNSPQWMARAFAIFWFGVIWITIF